MAIGASYLSAKTEYILEISKNTTSKVNYAELPFLIV